MSVLQLPVVGVMGSSERPNARLAAPLGRLLSRLGVHLLTGGGQATMAAVSKAFAETPERAGLCVGVVPAASIADPAETRPGYPNEWIELAIRTHLIAKQPELWDGLTRNHINILSSDAVIALPGSTGTRHEIDMALRYERPVATFHGASKRPTDLPDQVCECRTIDEVEAFLREALGERLKPAL